MDSLLFTMWSLEEYMRVGCFIFTNLLKKYPRNLAGRIKDYILVMGELQDLMLVVMGLYSVMDLICFQVRDLGLYQCYHYLHLFRSFILSK